MKPTNLKFTSGVLLTFMPDVFSCKGVKGGWGTCPSQPHQHIFFGGGGKFNVCGAMNFGKIKKIRFVIVKIFPSYSNQFLVILIWSS